MLGASKRLWMPTLVVVLVAVVGVVVLARAEEDPDSQPRGEAAAAPRSVEPAGLQGHLRALQRIADRNGGNRAAGTAGDRASADYVAARLRAAGYEVRRQRVRFPFFDETAPPRVALGGDRLDGLATLTYSPGGSATGAVRAITAPRGAAGCQASEFSALRRGEVAVIERGTCRLRTKVDNAARAGAAAVVIYNDGRPGNTGTIAGSLVSPGAKVPAVFASSAAGARLVAAQGREVTVRVQAVSEQRTTTNVVGERTPSGTGGDRVVMAGAHLDSVPAGAGINDNGSGVAALLNAAETVKPRRPMRIAFWGAEELGLIGSKRYVRSLSDDQRRRIAVYMNLDMVGSPNAGRFVYASESGERSAAVARRALRARGVRPERTDLGYGSDHASFQRAGVPVFGLFSGAGGTKSAEQARRWGGRAGQPYDRCYHQRCDRTGGLDRRALRELGGGAADTLRAMTRAP